MPEEEQKTEEQEEEEDDSLAFANAQVVRVIRANVAPDKMIKSEVKKSMNRFLEEVCADVSQRMNKYPYAMIDRRMFDDATEQYKTMNKVVEEKKRIISHLEAIKEDCNKLIRDVDETFVGEEAEGE